MTGTRARSQASLTRAFAKAAYDIYCNVLEDELKTLYEEVEDFSCTTEHTNNDRAKTSLLPSPFWIGALLWWVFATRSLGSPDF